MKPAPNSSKGRNSRPKKKKHDWYGHTLLVTYDVFKRVYWSRLPQSLTKGLCVSSAILSLCLLTSLIKHHLSRSANFLVWSLVVPLFLGFLAFAF